MFLKEVLSLVVIWILDARMQAVLPKCKAVCLTRNDAKQYQNTGVWNRERFIIIAGPCKEMGSSCLQNPQTPQKLSAKPFSRKGEGGMC